MAEILAAAPTDRETTGWVRPNTLSKIRDRVRRFLADPSFQEISEPLLPASTRRRDPELVIAQS